MQDDYVEDVMATYGRADANGDGVLDIEEFSALWEALATSSAQ